MRLVEGVIIPAVSERRLVFTYQGTWPDGPAGAGPSLLPLLFAESNKLIAPVTNRVGEKLLTSQYDDNLPGLAVIDFCKNPKLVFPWKLPSDLLLQLRFGPPVTSKLSDTGYGIAVCSVAMALIIEVASATPGD